MTAPALSLRDLKKTYARKGGAEVHALKGITLEVARGSFFGLLGPNGAGKSTLINILAGLTVKTSGTAEICGYDTERQMRLARLSIGVVPQELVVDTFFTAREALDIHAGYYGVPKEKRRTQEIIDAMGLADKADIHTRRLSGGMKRRLLIAKALVHNPPVLILDEPTAGVDVELRQQLWAYVRKLNTQGTTVLLTTHYLEEAEELCDHIAIINHGEVIAHDSKKQMMKKLDQKQITLRPQQALAAVPPALARFGAMLGAEGEIIIRYAPSATSLEELLNAVHAAGLTIRDLSTQEADLEDIFRHLTTAKKAA